MAAVISNNAQPKCIRVKKVYDWVITSESAEKQIPFSEIPEPCLGIIQTALEEGKSVTISCSAPTIPNTVSPVHTKCQTQSNSDQPGCQAISIKRPVAISSTSNGAIVKVLQIIPITLEVFIGDIPDPACTFPSSIDIRQEIFLCLPEPLGIENILCHSFQLICNTSVITCNNNLLLIDITVCKEVRVEADVQLEVLAKYCRPRLPIAPPTQPCPIAFDFPKQCPFFPPPGPTCCNGVTDEVCGSFDVTCDGTTQTIWEVGPGLPTINGSIEIFLEGSCPSIDVIVNGIDVFTVLMGISQTFTFPALGSIALRCNGTTPCSGTYCLSLHYALSAL